MTLNGTLSSIKAAPVWLTRVIWNVWDKSHYCHNYCFQRFCSIVVCGKYWLFLSSVDLQVVSIWAITCQTCCSASLWPHNLGQEWLTRNTTAQKTSDCIPVWWKIWVDCRLMCHLRLLLGRSLIRLEPGCLLPRQCLSSDSMGFLNTYPRPGSKDGGKYGSGLKVKSTMRHNKREPLPQHGCDRRCFWQLINKSWLW